jgi:hemolysin activation/secretion protein
MFAKTLPRTGAMAKALVCGAFVGVVATAALPAFGQSGVPTNNEGVSLKSFGQEAASSRRVPSFAPAAASGEDAVVLPPIPHQLKAPDVGDSWWKRRKAKVEAKREQALREQARAAEQAARSSVRPVRMAPTVPSAAVAPAAARMPKPSFEESSQVPVNNDGRSLTAFGSEPRQSTPAFVRRALDADREIDPSASKFTYSDPFNPAAMSSDNEVFTVTPVVDPGGQDVADPTPLISNLDGIVLVSAERDVRDNGARGVQGILNEGVILPPKVEQVLAANLNQPLSLASLDAMVREAVVAYRSSDMPVVDVLVPEQQIQTGVLQLVIIEGRVGEVIVEGNTNSSDAFLRQQISLRNGEVLSESALMQDLAWINKNPFRRVDLIYSPGRDYGTTDVILRTEETRPFSAYVGYEDSGNELIGQDRFLAGINWGGPLFFSNENVFSYQYVSDFDFNQLQGHSAVWTSYLPWKHQLTLLGAHVTSDATISVDDQLLAIGGENNQGSVRYAIPMPRTGGRFTHELDLGFDFKSSNSNLFFNQLEVFDTTSDIVQFGIGYNLVGRDNYGTTRVDSDIFLSPGGLTSQNDDETFRSQRGGADATYAYTRLALERSNNLPNQFSLVTRVEGQLSSTNLLASETLGAGGFDTVRGYDQRLVRGDNGILASVELRTPTLSLTNVSGFRNVRDGLQFLTFYDYGYLQNTDVLEGEPGHLSLGSVGAGLRYQLDRHLSLRLDYGYQVNESGFDDGEDGRVHIGARATF